jgi:hypothetical protein
MTPTRNGSASKSPIVQSATAARSREIHGAGGSKRWTCTRGFLARLVGWSHERTLELAVRSLKLVAEHQAALVRCGEGDLVPTTSDGVGHSACRA